MIKPFWRSKTIISSLFGGVIAAAVAVSTPVANIRCRSVGEASAACGNARDIAFIVTTVGGLLTAGAAGVAVKGRVDVGDIYTPHGMIGPDREDVEDQFVVAVADAVRDKIPEDRVRYFDVVRRFFRV